MFCFRVFQGYVVVPDQLHNILQEQTGIVPRWFHILPLIEFHPLHENMGDSGSVATSMIYVSVSFANNFVHSPTGADHGYHSFRQLARFVYCLLQKITKGSSFSLVQQWVEYVTPNPFRLPAIDKEDILSYSFWDARNDCSEQSSKSLFEDYIWPSCPSFLWGNCELFSVRCSFKITYRIGNRQFLPCYCDWRGWCRSFPAFQQALRWAFRREVDKKKRSLSVQCWVPVVIRTGTAAAGAVVQDKPPWLRVRPVFPFCTGWFPFSAAPV